MRRKDRDMNADFGLDFIDRADFGVLSLVDSSPFRLVVTAYACFSPARSQISNSNYW